MPGGTPDRVANIELECTVQATKNKPTTVPNITNFRKTIGSYLGKVLTPELATEIELSIPGASLETIRQRVDRLETEASKLPAVDCPVRHYFAPGLYAREVTIYKGTTLIGLVHKVENFAVLSKGRLLLATEDGPLEISGRHTLVIKPGAKNAAVALEDSVWTNFFQNPTNETDIDKLVELLTESKASEILGGSQSRQVLMQAEFHKLEN